MREQEAVLLPTTSAGMSGFGTQHGLVEGSTVFGFFRDESQQNPIITGTVAGIPLEGRKVDVFGKEVARDTDYGFSDPRRIGKGLLHTMELLMELQLLKTLIELGD